MKKEDKIKKDFLKLLSRVENLEERIQAINKTVRGLERDIEDNEQRIKEMEY